MKIVALVRTRNEERNIARFCKSYNWVDKILVADGGSIDRTKEIASEFDNVIIKDFEERIQMENGLWRNPEAEHINFLIEWAEEENAEWVLFDDCDCFPNPKLIREGRDLFKNLPVNYIHVVKLYVYGIDKWFPQLSKPGMDNEWCPALWAWRLSTGLRFKNSTNAYETTFKIPDNEIYKLYPPFALLHYAWPDHDEMMRKVNFYRRSGQIPSMQIPTDFGGPLERLPEWAICE